MNPRSAPAPTLLRPRSDPASPHSNSCWPPLGTRSDPALGHAWHPPRTHFICITPSVASAPAPARPPLSPRSAPARPPPGPYALRTPRAHHANTMRALCAHYIRTMRTISKGENEKKACCLRHHCVPHYAHYAQTIHARCACIACHARTMRTLCHNARTIRTACAHDASQAIRRPLLCGATSHQHANRVERACVL